MPGIKPLHIVCPRTKCTCCSVSLVSFTQAKTTQWQDDSNYSSWIPPTGELTIVAGLILISDAIVESVIRIIYVRMCY